MAPTNLKGKVAIITGSTSGIGLGIAKALGQSGATLVLNGIMESHAAALLCSSLSEELRTPVRFHGANMASAADIQNLLDDTLKAFDRVDIVVNNAGIQHVAPVEDFPPEKWDAILAINLSSAFHMIRGALPKMRAQGWGRIINVASAHGLVASANKTAYVAAKHGLIGLTKAVALETATSPITCNAICPGWVLTPLVEKQIADRSHAEKISMEEAKRQLLADKQPSGEFVTVDQIGAAAAFLCTKAADQIRGLSMNMDGGWLAQ